MKTALIFYHYAALKPTISSDPSIDAFTQIGEEFGGNTLDMRTVVANISRNIKIQGTVEDETGGHL